MLNTVLFMRMGNTVSTPEKTLFQKYSGDVSYAFPC
jgi:hypothetical protein